MGFPEVIQFVALGHSKAIYCPPAIYTFHWLLGQLLYCPLFWQPGHSVSWASVLLASSFICGAVPMENPSLESRFSPPKLDVAVVVPGAPCHSFKLLSPSWPPFYVSSLPAQKMMADQLCSKFCKLHEALLCFFSSSKAEQF